MKSLLIALISAGAMIAMASLAHADADQASAEQAVEDGYIKYQKGCTPTEPPRFQSISWDFFYPPGTDPSGHVGGSGRIHDADPALGGPFVAVLDTGALPPTGAVKVGGWDVVFEFC
jgi:hypothetical protein